MANYYSTCRTNYFKVKDVEAFKKWVEDIAGENKEFIEDTGSTHSRGVGLLFSNGIPDMKHGKDNDGADILVEFDFFKELKTHLKKGEVAIYVEAGAEKARYVTGFAVAVSPGKKDIQISIDDIYELAQKKFKIKKISRAEF